MARKATPAYASRLQIAVFTLLILAGVMTIYGCHEHFRSERAGWSEIQVSLMEFRTMPLEVLEGKRGTRVIFQAQARVSYAVDAGRYDLWFPILSPSDNQQSLQFEFSNLKKKPCYIHWDRGRPAHAFLTCDATGRLP